MEDQRYNPEQILIRKECHKKRRETLKLIKEEKWDLIKINTCVEDCTICNNRVMGKIEDHPIKCILTCLNEFNLNAQKTIENLYGENGKMTQEKWFLCIMMNPPSYKNLTYFIENKLIRPDYSTEVTLLSLYAIYMSGFYWKNTFDFILIDIGFNINLQDIFGQNILLSILREDYDDNDDNDDNEDNENFYPEEREQHFIQNYNEKIYYLLEKGADPLLEDKEGISSIEYARNLKTFPQDQKDELIRIIERYI